MTSRLRAQRETDGCAEAALWMLATLAAFAGYVWLLLQSFSTVGCEGICHDELIYAPFAAYPWEVAGAFSVAIVVRITLARSRRPTLWAALLALVVVLGAAIITSAVREVGFAPMHERNARVADGTPEPVPPPPDPTGSWGTTAMSKPHLDFLADGTMVGNDGCNALTGSWSQTSDGVIVFRNLSVTDTICDGVDTWLSSGRSAAIRENYLYVSNADGAIIGGLMPSP